MFSVAQIQDILSYVLLPHIYFLIHAIHLQLLQSMLIDVLYH